MKKRYPRRKQPSKFDGYYVAQKDLITNTTLAVDRQIYPLIFDIINSTKKELCLAFFQMTLDKRYLRGLSLNIFSILKSRLDDGVIIKVLLNQKFANAIQRELNEKTYNLLKEIGVDCAFSTPKFVLHSKLIISDGEKALVGSMNMTATSLCENHEVAVYVRSPLVKQILVPYFEALWLG